MVTFSGNVCRRHSCTNDQHSLQFRQSEFISTSKETNLTMQFIWTSVTLRVVDLIWPRGLPFLQPGNIGNFRLKKQKSTEALDTAEGLSYRMIMP